VFADVLHSRRDRLQKLFSAFPDGLPGVGLILLRLTAGASTIFHAVGLLANTDALAHWAAASLSMLIGIALLIGFLTPISGGLVTLIYLTLSFYSHQAPHNHCDCISAMTLAVISAALVLLGPGAFSLDARLFGHREILIPRQRG
jgi:uncharacterized membrane protein YphA (DoxX/SURF4 family)